MLRDNIRDREYDKFKADENDETAVNVTSAQLEDIKNLLGGSADITTETLQFTGSVDTTPVSYPDTATNDIIQILVSCQPQFPSTNRLLVSFDNGTTFFTLSPGSMVGWSADGIKQIQVKGNVTGVLFDILVNRVV